MIRIFLSIAIFGVLHTMTPDSPLDLLAAKQQDNKKVFGETLLVAVENNLSSKERNRYFYSKYPSSDFFLSAYTRNFLAELNKNTATTQLSVRTLGEEDLAWLETLFPKNGGDENGLSLFTEDAEPRYTFLGQESIALQRFTRQELKTLLRRLGQVQAETAQHFMVLNLEYSVIDQKVKQQIRLFDRQGKQVYTRRIKYTSPYVLYDKDSPYLIIDDYLYQEPSTASHLEEVGKLAGDLSQAVAEKFVSKLLK